jgi:hypothetical protein
MNNIFLTSGSCDSFINGVVTTTLPQPIDIREEMGINLCELSFGRIVNVPRGLNYTINGVQRSTHQSYHPDIEEFLNSLCVEKGYSFTRENGKIVANFPKNGEMEISPRLQNLTGLPEVVRKGTSIFGGWDLFHYVPYLVVEVDVVEKRPFGVSSRYGVRMVPLEYKNHILDWEHFRFQFKEPNFVPLQKGSEIETIKLCFSTRDGVVVPFAKGGCLQAHLQLCPVRSRLLV